MPEKAERANKHTILTIAQAGTPSFNIPSKPKPVKKTTNVKIPVIMSINFFCSGRGEAKAKKVSPVRRRILKTWRK